MAKAKTPAAETIPEDTCTDNQVGRPTSYRSEYANQAYTLCLLHHAKDEDLAAFFDVCVATIYNWKNEFPEFLEATIQGKLPADANIASKLYERAEGARWTEQVAIKIKVGKDVEQVEVIELQKEAPPDTAACLAWLKNRQPRYWRGRKIEG